MRQGRYCTVLTVVFVLCPFLVKAQASGPEATQNFKFFMDSTKDCNGPVYNIFNREAVITGHSSQPVQQSPLSCTIRLSTENNYEKTRFKITIRAMKIEDPDVKLVIYDGEPGQLVVDSYDIGTSGRRPERVTTSNKVSLVLTRRDARNSKYDIEIVVQPLVAGVDPGYDNDWGNDYGYFNRRVPNTVIYIIVGVLFLIIIVVIIIVGVVCHRKHKGLTKKAEQYKLSYISNNINLGRGPASETSTRAWVTTSRNSLHRERKPHRHDDDESVFDGSEADSIPSKKRYDHDQSYEKPNSRDRNLTHDRGNCHPSYRNDSYVETLDDDSRDMYIQREMKPSFQSTRSSKPEEEEEEDVDSIGVGPDEEEVSEEEEETEQEEGDEEDVDSVSSLQPQSLQVSDHHPSRSGHPHALGVPQPIPRQTATHEQPHYYPKDPRRMPVTGPYVPSYVVYPGQPRAQIMPGQGQFQPIQPPMPQPPRYPPRPYQVKPSDPPIYSYLVQRGYNPEDGRESPVSVSTNASGKSDSCLIRPEDSDLSARNLDAGIEYMRR